MSRKSTPKPAAAAPSPGPANPAAAPAAATPDPAMTLPQVAPDTTGAAVAAAAPVDPSPNVPETPTAKGFVLRVKGPAKGRWRAGRHFGPEPVDIPAADLTEDEIARLHGDAQLTVEVVGEA